MGLLDELEQEAQKRRASADEAEKHKAEREDIFRTQLEPGMTALFAYLTKLVASLKILQPKKQISYALNGYGTIVGYAEHEYELKVNQQPGSREITLGYPCAIANDECPTVEVQGASKVRTVAAAFQRYHLGGLLEPKKDGSGEIVSAKFKAKGRIPQTAIFSADADSSVIKVTLTNFDSLGTAVKNVPANQFNDALFDDIGRYLTHEPSGLFRENLPDSYRNQLRTKVQQEQIKRRWETKISAQQQPDLDKLKRDQSIANKFAKKAPAEKLEADKPADNSWLGRLKGLVKKDR
ncbi:MAG TPA: hypothetical protein VHW73_06390 [Rudaea sp.]|nr:hypothetical protein [Rudaea sp.]